MIPRVEQIVYSNVTRGTKNTFWNSDDLWKRLRNIYHGGLNLTTSALKIWTSENFMGRNLIVTNWVSTWSYRRCRGVILKIILKISM